MINKHLLKKYEAILAKHKWLVEKINSQREIDKGITKRLYSKIFLPAYLESMGDEGKGIMLMGRETRGWGLSSQWAEYQTVTQLMMMYKEDYLKGIPKRKGGLPLFLKQVEAITHIKPFWTNFYCTDYKKSNPKNGNINLKDIQDLSLDLLTAQIEVLKPQAIIIGYGRGVDAKRVIIKTLLESLQGAAIEQSDIPQSDFGRKIVYQKGLVLYDLHYHPAARIKGSSKVRKLVVEDLSREIKRV